MKAIDFRNATFWSIRDSLEGARRRTYAAWRRYGPGTTREIAEKSGMSLLTLRPRATELLQVGLIQIVCDIDGNPERRKREGVYAITPVALWNRWKAEQVNSQLQLI